MHYFASVIYKESNNQKIFNLIIKLYESFDNAYLKSSANLCFSFMQLHI